MEPGESFELVEYRVVQIDGATGATTVLHATHNRDEARQCWAEAKDRRLRTGLRVVLIARCDPGWTVFKGS